MSESYSYPEREHIEAPTSLIHMIDIQTDVFMNTDTPGTVISGISELYDHSKFARSAVLLASLTKLSVAKNLDQVNYQDTINADSNFLAGAIVGVHVNVAPLSALRRGWILGIDPFANIQDPELPDDTRSRLLACLSQDLDEWHRGKGVNCYGEQTAELQEKILELSMAVYKDVASPNGQDEIFINGFMFMSQLVRNANKVFNSLERGFLPKVP